MVKSGKAPPSYPHCGNAPVVKNRSESEHKTNKNTSKAILVILISIENLNNGRAFNRSIEIFRFNLKNFKKLGSYIYSYFLHVHYFDCSYKHYNDAIMSLLEGVN